MRKAHNATATVFVKDGDEFVRVSTNVLTPEGKRGIGTQLARNKAYDAVSKGEQYCGPIDVLGTAFDACYNPIKDARRQDRRRELHRPQEVARVRPDRAAALCAAASARSHRPGDNAMKIISTVRRGVSAACASASSCLARLPSSWC